MPTPAKSRFTRLGSCLLLFIASAAPRAAEAAYSRDTVIAANVGISAILGAVGAAYHAKPGARLKGFWKGLVYGGAGGGLITLGKYTATEIPRNGLAGWTSKGLVSAGASVTENVMNGRPPFSVWATDFGPLWISYSTREAFGVKLLPMNTVHALYAATLPGSRFDFKKTAQTGTFTFWAPRPESDRETTEAFSVGNSIVLFRDGVERENAFPHEVIHAYQERQGMAIDSYYEGTFGKYRFSRWIRPDFFPSFLVPSQEALGYTTDNRKTFEESEADYFDTLSPHSP
jgi:hypothetical protein